MNNNLINATGNIPYGLTNDCMFHMVFQKDMVALKGLICAVLHLESEDIKEIEVCNPLEIGKSLEAKNFFLDLKIKLNNNTIVNLEMQIMNRGNWPERSLSYLCRNYDNLEKGEDYENVCSAVHIGFIDFTLFPDEPEFCATYMLSNVKTNRIYTSKFKLKVVELNQADIATDEDKYYKIDGWARLFKSTTWEELRMCAGEDAAMQSAVKMVYEYNEEEAVRDMCRARKEALAFEEYIKQEKERLLAQKEALESEIEQVVVEKEQAVVEKEQAVVEKEQAVVEKEQAVVEKETYRQRAESLEAEVEGMKSEMERLKKEIEGLRKGG